MVLENQPLEIVLVSWKFVQLATCLPTTKLFCRTKNFLPAKKPSFTRLYGASYNGDPLRRSEKPVLSFDGTTALKFILRELNTFNFFNLNDKMLNNFSNRAKTIIIQCGGRT